MMKYLIGIILTLSVASSALAGSWKLHGYDTQNTANSSSATSITKDNLHKLKIKWIYNIDAIPTEKPGDPPNPQFPNPVDNPRAENAPATGVAVDSKGKVYVPIFDGRILVIDSNQTVATEGSDKPLLLKTYDLFGNTQYSGASELDGDDVFATRTHPSIIGNDLYAGGYNWFLATTEFGIFADKGMGVPTPTNPTYESKGAVLYSINRNTGKLNWKTIIDDHPQTMISAASISGFDGLLFVGFGTELSGTLGLFGVSPTLDPFDSHCCDYRGGLVALDKKTGEIVWKTYTMPKQNFPSFAQIIGSHQVDAWGGTSIWGGGNFPISQKHKLIYAGTGEAYFAPMAADECEQNRTGPLIDNECLKVNQDGTINTGNFADSIIESLNPTVRSPTHPLLDSVIAYDYRTGEIKWAVPVGGFDVWNLACFAPLVPIFTNFDPFCPSYLRNDIFLQFSIKDLDVAEQPMLVENVKMGDGSMRDMVLVTAKSANVYAFDAETGEELWGPVSFGPGNLGGDGFIWGSATDGKRFYSSTGRSSDITLSNLHDADKAVVVDSCPLNGFDPVSGKWNGGMHVAVELATGNIAWQRCVVAKEMDGDRLPTGVISAGRSQAPVSVANGVVLAPGASLYAPPGFPADNPFAEVLLLDADTGELLRTLSLSAPGKPSANTLFYQRPIAIGNRIFITNGSKRYDGMSNETDQYNRIIMYELDD